MKYKAIAALGLILLTACSDDFWTLSPTLDNRWDPENPNYSPPAFPSEEIAAEYLFNGDINDSSGNALHCTGTPGSFVTDRLGNESSAIIFDGINNYLEIPDPNLGKFSPTVPMTISFWFKSNNTGKAVIGYSHRYQGSEGWYITASSSLHFSSVGGTETATFSGTTDNEWHHIVIMNTDFTLEFYIDGQKNDQTVDTSALEYPTDSADEYFFLGARYTNYEGDPDVLGSFYSGYLDDIRFYNHILTEDEIMALVLEGLID